MYCHDLVMTKCDSLPPDFSLDLVSCFTQRDVSTHVRSGGLVCMRVIGLPFCTLVILRKGSISHQPLLLQTEPQDEKWGNDHKSLATANPRRMRNSAAWSLYSHLGQPRSCRPALKSLRRWMIAASTAWVLGWFVIQHYCVNNWPIQVISRDVFLTPCRQISLWKFLKI